MQLSCPTSAYLKYFVFICVFAISLSPIEVSASKGQVLEKPEQVFLTFWKGFMMGDVDVVEETMRSIRTEGMTSDDLEVRAFYPPIISVEAAQKGAEGVTLLSLLGTYVHPYDAKTMGELSTYEQRFGALPVVELTYDELLTQVSDEFAQRLRSFVKDNNTQEIWLLDIPGRALLVKEDGVWKVDIYHFDDKTMQQTAPRRLLIDAAAKHSKVAQ